MKLRGLSTRTLYVFRWSANMRREWKLAKAYTDELARRGEFGARERAA